MAFVYSIQNEPSERSNEVRIKDVEDKDVTSPSLVGPQEVLESETRGNLCELFADETPLRDSVPREMSEDPEHLVPLPGNPESLPTETLLEVTSKECYDCPVRSITGKCACPHGWGRLKSRVFQRTYSNSSEQWLRANRITTTRATRARKRSQPASRNFRQEA